MKSKIITTVLLAIFVCTPAHHLLAIEAEEYEVLEAQVAALSKYIERNFVSHEATTLSTDQLRKIVQEGTRWLISSQEENGHFAYEYSIYDDAYMDDDHIVRQAGALYELGEIARRDPEDTLEVGAAIEKAIGFFEPLSDEVEEDGETFRCVVDSAASSKCRMGATALALLGVLGYVENNADAAKEHATLIEGYSAYILAMKKDGEGFRDMFNAKGTTKLSKESSFSNGEALLALVRYYQYNPRTEVKEVIEDTFTYLEAKEEFETPLYLWSMAALKDMQVLWPNERYTTYAQNFTNLRRRSLSRVHYTEKNYCATTEGLASAYSVLKGTASERELAFIRTEIDFWNTHNSVLQILPVDRYRLVLTDDVFMMKLLPNLQQAQGGFLTSGSIFTQRIDYTQHCISAYLQTLVDIEGGVL